MFDAYHKWLGIPPEKQPATYYLLLGIQPEETDREVIEEAAIRQSVHLRSYQLGPHAEQCARLLNEIAAAKAVLLNPAKRIAYDAQLTTKHAVQAGRAAPKMGHGITPAKPAAVIVPAASAGARHDDDEIENRRRDRKRRRDVDIALGRKWYGTKVALGIFFLLLVPIVIVGALYFVLRGSGGRDGARDGNQVAIVDRPAEVAGQPVPPAAAAKPGPAPQGAAPAPANQQQQQPKPAIQQQPAQQIEGGLVLAEDRNKHFRHPILSPDGRRAVFTSSFREVHFWDLDAKKEIARGETVQGNGDWAMSGNGQFIAVPGNDALEVWNMQVGEKVQTIQHPLPVRSIALSPDGKTVASGTGEIDVGPDGKQRLVNGVTTFKDCVLRLWDVSTGKMTRSWAAHDTVIVKIHVTGSRVLSSGAFGSVHEVELAGGQEKRSKDTRVIRQNFSTDGSRMLGTLQDNRTLVLMDTGSRQILRQFASPSPTSQVKWSQNGKFAMVADTNKLITLWDVDNGRSMKSFAGPDVPEIAISADGRLALVTGLGSVRLLNLD